jgi:hypothetical protein
MSISEAQESSFSIRDAVALSANQFVAMRDQVSTIKPENSSVVLSWITLK